MDFCGNFSEKKKEEEQKNKEAELAELGILPKRSKVNSSLSIKPYMISHSNKRD